MTMDNRFRCPACGLNVFEFLELEAARNAKIRKKLPGQAEALEAEKQKLRCGD